MLQTLTNIKSSAFDTVENLHGIVTNDGWLVGFSGISTCVGYLMPNPFYANNQFFFKQFSLA